MSKTYLVMAHFDRELAALLQLNSFPVQYFNGKLKNAERTTPKAGSVQLSSTVN